MGIVFQGVGFWDYTVLGLEGKVCGSGRRG